MVTARYYNSEGSSVGGWSQLIKVGVDFGVGFLTANITKDENRKNQELLQQMAKLDAEQAKRLKALLSTASDNIAKTKIIIDYINSEKINQLQSETKKKRILPLIGLGFAVILLGSLIFYKLHQKNG